VGFGWFSLTFFAIKYRLTKNYVNMFDGFKSGLKEAENCTFIEYDDQIKAKDGVEFYVMRVKAKAKNRLYEDVDREILIYKESPKLDIKQGQKLKIITHSSILVAFEIVGE
jgi:triacylglycerol esterase/lipase EstA (alpha/beta hydrolase family)